MTRTAAICSGAREHTPQYAEIDNHHLYPRYLCGLLGVPERRETVQLCSGCHDLLHHVLHHCINAGTLGGHRLSAGLKRHVEAAWQWWRVESTV